MSRIPCSLLPPRMPRSSCPAMRTAATATCSSCGATWTSATCRSATCRRRRFCIPSACTQSPAKRLRSSARPAAARRPSPTCLPASTTLRMARALSPMTASPSSPSRRTISAARWAWFCRTRICLPVPSGTTSAMATLRRARRRCLLPRSLRMRTALSAIWSTATIP